MPSKVLVFVTDETYLPHYKSLAVNCRNEGQYTGDFLCICPDTGEPWIDDLASRGFRIATVPDRGFLAKFNVFQPFLREWEQAMYIDADVIVQLPLQPLFDQLTAWPRDVEGKKKIITNREEVPVFMAWQIWDKEWQEHTAIYEKMNQSYPHLMTSDKMFSTCLLLFEPASIDDGTTEELRRLQKKYFVCNDPEKGGTDEQVIDLHLHGSMIQCAEKGWCYWGLDEFASSVPSVGRGWRGDEIPVVVHYCRWYAPWIVKTPDADAYDNNRIGRVCHEFYADNLAAFNETFPIKG